MFDIGWTELLVLAVVAILIVGPKELPRMLYALGQTVNKLRRSADEFRRQFNESMREAGMDDIRNDMKKMSDLNPAHQVKNEIESTFRDQPKPAKDATAKKPAGDEQTGSSAEADREPAGTGQQDGKAAADEAGDSETAEPTQPAPSAPETAAQPEPEHHTEHKAGSGARNTNGAAATAKDAVS